MSNASGVLLKADNRLIDLCFYFKREGFFEVVVDNQVVLHEIDNGQKFIFEEFLWGNNLHLVMLKT